MFVVEATPSEVDVDPHRFKAPVCSGERSTDGSMISSIARGHCRTIFGKRDPGRLPSIL